jgi:thiol-disulfide isomerase/thioredoxin
MAYAREHGELLELRRAGTEPVDGVVCDKVFAHIKTGYQGEAMEYWETWYVARGGLVRRKRERIELGGKPGYTRDDVIRNIRLNAPITASTFTYKPPKGVLSEADYARLHPRPAPLKAGVTAPDFTALDIDNNPIRLSDLKGKVVVVDFWASWCPPCVASMPHNQEVAKKLQAEGLPVIVFAVDNSEERDAFSTWVKGKRDSLPDIRFAHIPPKTDVAGKLFNVSGIPTQYILDANGIVRASFVGFDGGSDALEKAIRAALATGAP